MIADTLRRVSGVNGAGGLQMSHFFSTVGRFPDFACGCCVSCALRFRLMLFVFLLNTLEAIHLIIIFLDAVLFLASVSFERIDLRLQAIPCFFEFGFLPSLVFFCLTFFEFDFCCVTVCTVVVGLF